MDSRVGLDNVGHLPDLELERCVLERLLHLPAREEAEVTLGRVRRAVRLGRRCGQRTQWGREGTSSAGACLASGENELAAAAVEGEPKADETARDGGSDGGAYVPSVGKRSWSAMMACLCCSMISRASSLDRVMLGCRGEEGHRARQQLDQ